MRLHILSDAMHVARSGHTATTCQALTECTGTGATFIGSSILPYALPFEKVHWQALRSGQCRRAARHHGLQYKAVPKESGPHRGDSGRKSRPTSCSTAGTPALPSIHLQNLTGLQARASRGAKIPQSWPGALPYDSVPNQGTELATLWGQQWYG